MNAYHRSIILAVLGSVTTLGLTGCSEVKDKNGNHIGGFGRASTRELANISNISTEQHEKLEAKLDKILDNQEKIRTQLDKMEGRRAQAEREPTGSFSR